MRWQISAMATWVVFLSTSGAAQPWNCELIRNGEFDTEVRSSWNLSSSPPAQVRIEEGEARIDRPPETAEGLHVNAGISQRIEIQGHPKEYRLSFRYEFEPSEAVDATTAPTIELEMARLPESETAGFIQPHRVALEPGAHAFQRDFTTADLSDPLAELGGGSYLLTIRVRDSEFSVRPTPFTIVIDDVSLQPITCLLVRRTIQISVPILLALSGLAAIQAYLRRRRRIGPPVPG